MTLLGLGKNDYDTPVSLHVCDDCGSHFTTGFLNERNVYLCLMPRRATWSRSTKSS